MSRSSQPKTKNGFVTGAIVKIKLQDFMTYDELQVNPGPRMNAVIGPNGTGKSTVLCGICLGLGGRPGIIGRAQYINEYIKHGCNSASIEIELCNCDGDNFIISRKLFKNNQSEWKINKQSSNQKSVDALVAKLSIQMKNLCQFLPQDRVADFVKMTPEQLLENTEKAAGKIGMYEDHCKLKDNNNMFKDLETAVDRLKAEHDREMQKKTQLEEQVKIFNERQSHLEKIEMLRKKIAWMEYEIARRKVTTLKQSRNEKLKEINEMKIQLDPLKQRVLEVQKSVDQVETEVKPLVDNVKKGIQKVDGIIKDIEKYSDEMSNITDEYSRKKYLEDERISKFNQAKKYIATLENQLKSTNYDEKEIMDAIDSVGKSLQVTTNDITQCQHLEAAENEKKRSINVDLQDAMNELTRMKDINRQRMEMLRHRHAHTHTATMWLRQNLDKFKRTIHEPMILSLNVVDPKWARYVERQIPFKDIIAFVCEDANDMEVFMSCVRDQQNLRINAVLAPNRDSSNFRPQLPLDQIRNWGFQTYMREVIDAPEAIISYLCSQYQVYNIPIGNEDTKKNITRVLGESPFRLFYTANHQYVCSVSRYGNKAKSTRSSEISAPSILTANVDAARLQLVNQRISDYRRQLQQVDAKISELSERTRSIGVQMEELRTKKRDLVKQKDARKTIMFKINHTKASLITNAESEIDLAKEKQLGNEKMRKLINAKQKLIVENIKPLEREAEVLRIEFTRQLNAAKELLKKAQKETGITDAVLPEDMEDTFKILPSTLEELESELHQHRVTADCLYNSDDDVLRTYDMWKRNIDKLTMELEGRQKQLLDYQQDMTAIEQRWLPPLMALINQVNSKFGQYFKRLDCVGEVGLRKGNGDRDFSKYGIGIKVKFRSSEQLRELTSHYQSGGERSVATILYLLALQEFIKLPFCCVDEINQGMDAVNEQRVLQLMTQSLCDESLSQYFLVTPKLLKNAEFEDNITIHWVCNGLIASGNITIKSLIKKRKKLNIQPR